MERPRDRNRSQQGFTLVELMVVLAVFTILATAGIPALQEMLVDHRHAAHVNTLVNHIQRARGEAVRHGHRVTLCPSADGSSCSNNSNGWGNGWLLFADIDGDGNVDANDTLLAAEDALRQGRIGYNRSRLTFLYDGTTAFNGTFTVCDARQQQVRDIVVSRGGRLRRAPGTTANCP